MRSKGIGINTHGGTIDGNLNRFEEDLKYFEKCGVDYVELCTHAGDIIINGKLNKIRLEQILKITNKYKLRYTMHAPNDLNLFDVRRIDIQKELFKSCIDFTEMAGAEIMVYHAGVAELDYEEKGWTLDKLKEIEITAIKELLPYAKSCGVKIAVENSNPLPPELFDHKEKVFAYGAFINELVEQIKKIDDKNVGITLDVGHLYLAANHYNYDFWEAVKLIKPYLMHLHIHDNFGKVMSSIRPYIYLLSFGEDDLHMPIGWGNIPYSDVLANINTEDLVFMMELKPRYYPDLPQCIEECKRLLESQ